MKGMYWIDGFLSSKKNSHFMSSNSMHHDSITDRISKMDKVLDNGNRQYKSSLEQSHADNSKVTKDFFLFILKIARDRQL